MRQRHYIPRNGYAQCGTRQMSLKKGTICGMTLLEVILAITIAGFVLTAAVSLLVSISSIWSERSERHFFADHVDGVTEFLNATLATAGFEIAPDHFESSDNSSTATPESANGDPQSPDPEEERDYGSETPPSGSLAYAADEPIRWESPPGFANYKDPLLNFGITDAPPILVSPENAPALGINAFLYFKEDEGLSLLWHSSLQEEVEDINDLQRTQISPLVKEMTYIYWDERFETWEEEDDPKKEEGEDRYVLPRFIKLVFEYEGETKERTLTIPIYSKSALIF